MSNNKQSSVEYLMDKLFDPSSMVKEQLEWFEQAKAMHKEEIRLIYEGLLQNVGTSIKQDDLPIFEQYYNETYGGNK